MKPNHLLRPDPLLRHLSRTVATLAFLPLLSLAAADSDPSAINPKSAGDATVRAETDDPTARREALQRWYETPLTPEYMKWLNDAAARERARNADMLPPLAADDVAAGSDDLGGNAARAGKVWKNLGPKKADFVKNGSSFLQKTDSGRPVSIVPHPTNANILYVATAGGGVWKTTDALNPTQPTWTAITESLGSLSCGALAMDPSQPSTLYLGLGDKFDGTGIGLTKTTNGGTTWGPIVYLGNSTRISDIRVAQNKPNIVLVATDAGLFRSTDSGASFALVPMALPSVPYCWSIAWAGGENYAVSLEINQYEFGDNGQVWFSSNNGATWKKASGLAKPTGVGRVTIASSPVNRRIMYAEAAIPNDYSRTDLADFFRSSDGGRTWKAMRATANGVTYTNSNPESRTPKEILNGQGWYNQMVMPSNVDANTVYFGGALLLAKVTKAHRTPVYRQMSNWLAQFSLPYVHADFHAAAYDAEGNLYAGTDGGIFRSPDNGQTWTDKCNVGIVSHLIYTVASSEAAPSVVLGGFQDNGTRLRDGNTATFNQPLGGDGFGADVHPKAPMKMLGSLYYNRIYKSTNGGSSFFPAASGILESNNPGAAPFITHLVPWRGSAQGDTVFTHANLKVYKTTNYADFWTPLGTAGFLTSGGVRNIGVAKSNGDVVGAVADGGRVFLTNNGGASWTQASALPQNGLSMSYISFSSTRPQTVYAASVAPHPGFAHLWKSTDFGNSWSIIDDGPGFPTGVPVNTIVDDPSTPSTLYAGTHLGVYRSLDGGNSWSRYGSGLPLVNVTDFYISPNGKRLRISTYGRGFWELLP